MAHSRSWMPSHLDRQSPVHSARTAVAAMVSLVVARLFNLAVGLVLTAAWPEGQAMIEAESGQRAGASPNAR